jgi:hypothetical protein
MLAFHEESDKQSLVSNAFPMILPTKSYSIQTMFSTQSTSLGCLIIVPPRQRAYEHTLYLGIDVFHVNNIPKRTLVPEPTCGLEGTNSHIVTPALI